MIEILIVIATAVVLTTLSRRANRRLRDHAQLPMQWSLNGEVNWTAPRAIALGFFPALAIAVMSAAAASSLLLTPRPGQEGLEIPILLLVGACFVAIHLLYLALLERTLRPGQG